MPKDSFLDIITVLPEACALVKTDGVLLEANRCFGLLLGLDAASLPGKNIFELTQDEPEKVKGYLRLCLANRSMVLGSLSFRRNHESVAMRCEGVNVQSAAGPLVLLRMKSKESATVHFKSLNDKIQLLSREILERRKIELALRQQHEWFRVTLASIGDAVITTDKYSQVTYLNPVAELLTGWKSTEAVSEPLEKVFQIVNENTHEPAPNPVEKALRLGQIVGLANHTALIAKDGTKTAIEDSAAPIKDSEGWLVGAVMVFHDVTTKRAAENTLRRSEQLLSDFFENAPIGMNWLAPDGTILRANQAELNLLGVSREEYVGHNISEFHLEKNALEKLLEELAKGHSVDYREAQLRCRDGSVKYVVISCNVFSEGGQFVHARCFTRDITEQKKAEDQLSKYATDLERQVSERTAHLHQTIQSLEGVCYTIAHDLRAPLRAINGYTQVLVDNYASAFDAAARTYLERVMKGAIRMDVLIHDLLAYAKLSHADLPLIDIDLDEMVKAVLKTMAVEIESRQAAILLSPLPWARASRTLLEQVIANLIGNALKFVEAGKLPKIEIWSVTQTGFVRIFVKDNGIGIDPEQHQRVFEMFQRLHSNEKTYQGTGVGLAIVKKGMERMGGKAGIVPTDGGGTCFYLDLCPVGQ